MQDNASRTLLTEEEKEEKYKEMIPTFKDLENDFTYIKTLLTPN